MKLTDLHPRWCAGSITTPTAHIDASGRHGMGVTFECPVHGAVHRLAVWFANPIDGSAPLPLEKHETCRWQRTGEMFDTISLTPSVDASINCECGLRRRRMPSDPATFKICTAAANAPGHRPCWHGMIKAGEVH